MSSPFATFRKNRQFWMAGLVLLAILAFVVAPAIQTATEAFRQGGAESTVYVRWDGGRMTVAEVETAMMKRQQLLNFLAALSKKVIEEGGEPEVPGFSRWPNGEIRSLGIDDDVTAERVCLTRIIQTKAAQMGVEFDDRAADDFLKSFCNGRITDEEFNDILRSSTSGLTIFDVRELLKQELTSTITQGLASGGLGALPPGKTWQDFLKLNQTIRIEAYPVDVNSYLDKVTSRPSEFEIQALYDEGKQRFDDPNSPDPGFLRLEQANIEYVESRFQDWTDREKEKLTEEEIRAEYDRLVELGQLRVPVAPESGDEPPTDQPLESDDSGQADSPVEADAPGPAPATSEPSAAEATESGAEPQSDAAGNPTEPATTEPALPSSEPPAAEPSATEEPSSDLQSHQPRGAATRLVAFVQDEATSDIGTETEKADDESAPSAPASEVQTPNEPTEAAADQPAADLTDATEPPEQTPDDSAATDQEPAPPEMRVMSFEEARDEVATQLARSRATPVADEVLTQLSQLMREYYTAFRQYEAYQNAGQGLSDKMAPPVRPNMRQFAETHGMKYGETGLADRVRLAGLQIGNSSIFSEGRSLGTVANLVTSPQFGLFNPMQSGFFSPETTDFYQYSFWKIDSRPRYLPQLTEIRDEVIAAWTRQQAQKLTEEAALEMANQVGAGDDPWEQVASGTSRALVVTTEPFPWLSRMGGGVVPTTVAGLDRVGEEFMRRVFATGVGKTGVAPNNPRTLFYVFRVIDKSPDLAMLQSRFQSDQLRQGPQAIANMELSEAGRSWFTRIVSELNVQFSN